VSDKLEAATKLTAKIVTRKEAREYNTTPHDLAILKERERILRWRRDNADRYRENKRRWGVANRDKEHATHRRWIAKNPLFSTWKGMIERCYHPNHISYSRYGGHPDHPVTVCDCWRYGVDGKSGYQCWLKYIMANLGPKPSPRHSIDRYPNPDGIYEPGNIRWATPEQQARNQKPHRSKLGIKGVYQRRNRYHAIIRIEGKNRSLGSFHTAEEAAAAYREAARLRGW
jgi:hypothetical protein